MSDLHVLCKIADVEYLLAADNILQMESFAGATKVPGAAGKVAGLVQIRGRVVPVLDMRIVFGLAPIAPSIDSRVVVMKEAERTVGLLVDSAREVIRIAADAFEPPPPVVARQTEGFVKAVTHVGERLLMLIDFGKVIGKEDEHGE